MRGRGGRPGKAPLAGAFVVLALLGAPAAAGCLAGGAARDVVVRHVIDGDTVILADGRHLRVIGIDTPELGHDGAPDEPFARAARQAAERLVLAAGRRLRLRFDAERRDSYGRLLAHVLLPDGRNLAEELLRAGLGVSLVVPPNVAGLTCYRAAEARARAARRGIWSHPRWRLRCAGEPLADAGRSVRVQGRVVSVRRTRRSIWIRLEGGPSVRVARRDWRWFGDLDWERLVGRTVTVRGRPYRAGGEWRLRLRHPADLEAGRIIRKSNRHIAPDYLYNAATVAARRSEGKGPGRASVRP